MRAPHSAPLTLTPTDRQDLELKLCARNMSRSVAVRIMIVLMCADGAAPTEIAKLVGVTRSVVYRWRGVFQTFGIPGLIRPRQLQRPRKYGAEIKQQILTLAASPPPPSERWWTAKLIAERLTGIPDKFVSALIRKAGIDLRAGRRKHYRY
jgi:transposase